MNKTPNGWNEWSRFVLKELERLNECYEGLRKEISETRVDIAKLQIKAGTWGAIAGLIPSGLALLYVLLK